MYLIKRIKKYHFKRSYFISERTQQFLLFHFSAVQFKLSTVKNKAIIEVFYF